MNATRIAVMPLLCLTLLVGTTRTNGAASAANLTGSWAMQGTGPAGLVASGGRVATLTLRQRGHALTGTLVSGRGHYRLVGVSYYPQARVTLKWHLSGAGDVHFSGSLQSDGNRLLGIWSDAHGNDGGTILVRLSHS